MSQEQPASGYERTAGELAMDEVKCTVCDSGLKLVCVSPSCEEYECPNCGARTFRKVVTTSVRLTGEVSGTALNGRDHKPIAFFETGRPELARHASLGGCESVHMRLHGPTPQNEDDVGAVCDTFVAALKKSGCSVDILSRGDADEDWTLRLDGRDVQPQVVRAIVDQRFWRTQACARESDEELSIEAGVAKLKAAIELKSSPAATPPAQRASVVLVLDASRVPAVALRPVVAAFLRQHKEWARSQGFHGIYIVGPNVHFVQSLA